MKCEDRDYHNCQENFCVGKKEVSIDRALLKAILTSTVDKKSATSNPLVH